MDVGTADLAVIVAARATGHQAVAKVDEASQGNEGEKDGMFKAHRMTGLCFLLEERPLAHMRPIGQARSI